MREAQSVYELFEEADIDGNGSISKEEFIKFGSNVDVPNEEEALELFATIDTDSNGEWFRLRLFLRPNAAIRAFQRLLGALWLRVPPPRV